MNKILRSYRLPEDVVDGLEAIPIGRITDHVVLALREYLERVNEDKSARKAPVKRTNAKRFVKPTVDEVANYCTQNSYDINAQGFIDYYESQGWKVGKNPMKDWKACIRTWVKRKQEKSNQSEVKRESLIERTERKARESLEATQASQDVFDNLLAEDGQGLYLPVDKR